MHRGCHVMTDEERPLAVYRRTSSRDIYFTLERDKQGHWKCAPFFWDCVAGRVYCMGGGVSSCLPPSPWLSQSQRFLNANAANLRMMQINSGKFVKFAYSRYTCTAPNAVRCKCSRSKSVNLSSDFEKTIRLARTNRTKRPAFPRGVWFEIVQ